MHVHPVSSLKCSNSLLSVELVCVEMVGKMSLVQLAKRALVQLLLAFGRQYSIALGINRDSADKDVLSACRKVARGPETVCPTSHDLARGILGKRCSPLGVTLFFFCASCK